MKKIIFLWVLFSSFIGSTIYLQAQTISGPYFCAPNQAYMYSASGFNGLVTWSVVNGTLSSPSGISTTVKWSANATVGTITASGNVNYPGNPFPLYTSRSITVKISNTPPIPPALNVKINLNSNSIVCDDQNIYYSLIGYDSNASINWIAENNMALISGQGSPNAIFKANGNGIGVVKAEVSVGGASTTIENNGVWIGTPEAPTQILVKDIYGLSSDFIYGTELKQNSYYDFETYSSGAESYTWTVGPSSRSGTIVSSMSNSTKVLTGSNFPGNLLFKLSVVAHNSCGSSLFEQLGYASPTKSMLRNLSSEKEYVSISDIKPDSEIKSIKVYSISGILVYSSKSILQEFNIQSLNLDAGIYIVEIVDVNGKVTREKVYSGPK